MSFDNMQAFSEGWGVFECDDGVTRIQRLDDPQSVDPNYSAEPVFEDDQAAFDFVLFTAARGSKYHEKAFKLQGVAYGQ